MSGRIVDVWMQHPTRRFLDQPFFESLRRWARQETVPDIPLSATIETMDQAGVGVGLLAAWWGPRGALIDNDEVASFVGEHPGRLLGIASVDLYRPMDAVRELRRFGRQRGVQTNVDWSRGVPPGAGFHLYPGLQVQGVRKDVGQRGEEIGREEAKHLFDDFKGDGGLPMADQLIEKRFGVSERTF